jgi:hypothetical protein
MDSTGKLGTTTSSRRYKENIENIGEITHTFMQLRPVKFNYKNQNPENIHYGLIAEEVETLFPELVVHNKQGEVETVQYHHLYAFLIKMIQEQQVTIDQLKADMRALQA